jgi:hypothetical protein
MLMQNGIEKDNDELEKKELNKQPGIKLDSHKNTQLLFYISNNAFDLKIKFTHEI